MHPPDKLGHSRSPTMLNILLYILDGWVKFFMLPRCILANSAMGGRCHWRDTLKSVRSRIAKWRAGEFAELWQGVVSENERLQRRHRRAHSDSPDPCALLTPAVLAVLAIFH